MEYIFGSLLYADNIVRTIFGVSRASNRTNTNVQLRLVYEYRPRLEYCSPVWWPSYKYLVDSVESVQRRFTKKNLPGFSSVSYSERLKFDTLELRRLYIDLTICFKICNCYVALDKHDFFAFNPLSRTRGHCFKITVPNSRINARQHLFEVRVIPAWNYLPTTVVTSPSVCIFKKRVSEIDLSSFLTIKI